MKDSFGTLGSGLKYHEAMLRLEGRRSIIANAYAHNGVRPHYEGGA